MGQMGHRLVRSNGIHRLQGNETFMGQMGHGRRKEGFRGRRLVYRGSHGEVTGEVQRLLTVLVGEMKCTDIQAALARRHEGYFRETYLIPLLTTGMIEMTIPDKPTSSKQEYRFTQKGRDPVRRVKGDG
jgi:hypothetical protein